MSARHALSRAGCCRVYTVGLLAAAAILSLPPSGVAQTDGPSGQVLLPLRIPDDHLRAAVVDALERSGTLRNLLTRVGQLKAIVYVQWTPVLPRGVEAATDHQVTVTPNVRYLRIGLRPARITDWVVSIVAHELRHVIEIVEAEAVDSSAIDELYRRLSGGLKMRVYETPAAVEAGLAVYRELRSARTDSRAGSSLLPAKQRTEAGTSLNITPTILGK